MKALYATAILLAAGPFAATGVLAQSATAAPPASTAAGGPMGTHDMQLTITAINPKTGMVSGTSSGMKLTLHFPADALAGVKKGDTITVHLSFSK